jgi:hypothetical protein
MFRFGFWLLLFAVAFLGSAGFAFVGFAAFSDAQYRCPGIQCSDARGSAVLGAGLFVVCSVVAWFSMKKFRRTGSE